MKLKEIYELAIKMGKEADPRGEKDVLKDLEKAQKAYDKLDKDEQDLFDKEKLKNPYSDTRILAGDKNKTIKTILTGIDIEAPEIILADRLNEKGEKIDLVLGHHPEGMALAELGDVMNLQTGLFAQKGILPNVAEALMEKRIDQVNRGIKVGNHNRAVDAAKLLDMPLMTVHTPADNLVTSFLDKYIRDKEPETVADIIKILLTIPEYKASAKLNAAPYIVSGSKNRSVGEIFVDFTGGTSGPADAIEKLAEAGVSTIIGMHMPEKNIEAAKKENLNVIIAGHISSDSIGMNLLLDALAANDIKIITCSGLIRVER